MKGKLSSPFNTREYLVSNIGDLFGKQPTISLNKKDRMYVQMKLFVGISHRLIAMKKFSNQKNFILGANLRTGCQGIFPLAHVVDIEYNEFDPSNHGGSLNAGGIKGGDGRKERYLLNYLGSIESSLYKGNVVLCQAVRKIVTSKFKPKPHPTVLEISDKGIKIVDKTKIIVSKHLGFKVK